MVEPPLSNYEVIQFLLNRGGRCTNYELVSNFRGILNDPQHQAEARLRFKDIINTVATVGEFQNVKYIELKKEYYPNSNGRSSCEDSEASGYSSLSSEASSYTSPLTQSFQPYWRYRLSSSPQVPPPPRRSNLDTVIQSAPPSKSFNRSVSESILHSDTHYPPRTRTVRSSSEEEQYKNIQVPNRQPPYRPRRNFSPSTPQNDYPPISEDTRRYSTGYYVPPNNLSLAPNSLPYYNPHQVVHQDFYEGEISLPTVTENSHFSSERSTSYQDISPTKLNFESENNKQVSHNHLNTHSNPQPLRTRINNEQSHQSHPDLLIPAKVNHSHRSSFNCDPRENYESASTRRKSIDCSRIERSPSNRSSISTNFSENGEDNDVFSDPNYLRTVTKLCLEKNRTSRGSPNHRINTSGNLEQQGLSPRIENRVGNLWQKEFLVNESSKNKSSHVFKESNQNTQLKDDSIHHPVEDFAPVPQERRRRSQDKSYKIEEETKESQESGHNKEEERKNEVPTSKVKDRVQHFDEMGKKQKKVPLPYSDKENRVSLKSTGMEDDVSISVLDPKLKKEWFVKSSQCDYHALVALLKKEPKLAALKDIASGFTALHWAAKQGDANIIKLIAGTYKVNPNIRSNGGYTPVHLASLYKHNMISHLLIHTYGADASLRDYNGKRADQYPHNYIRMVAGQKNVERRPLKQRPMVPKETIGNSFMRIGSLNLRKARKSAVFASVRGSNRNRNSVPELRFGSTRKKMNKKENLFIDKKSIVEKKDDEDSDSAYGFPSKKLET